MESAPSFSVMPLLEYSPQEADLWTSCCQIFLRPPLRALVAHRPPGHPLSIPEDPGAGPPDPLHLLTSWGSSPHTGFHLIPHLLSSSGSSSRLNSWFLRAHTGPGEHAQILRTPNSQPFQSPTSYHPFLASRFLHPKMSLAISAPANHGPLALFPDPRSRTPFPPSSHRPGVTGGPLASAQTLPPALHS